MIMIKVLPGTARTARTARTAIAAVQIRKTTTISIKGAQPLDSTENINKSFT